MEIFNDLCSAKKALSKAYDVMISDHASPAQKLEAFAEAMEAEHSIDILHKNTSDGMWARKYHAAQELRAICIRCDSEARAAAQKAYKEAYSRVMAERFSEIPPSVREEMEVKLTSEGWEFTVEY